MLEFFEQYFLIIIIISLFILFVIIGFLVDKIGKNEKKEKQTKELPSEAVIEAVPEIAGTPVAPEEPLPAISELVIKEQKKEDIKPAEIIPVKIEDKNTLQGEVNLDIPEIE